MKCKNRKTTNNQKTNDGSGTTLFCKQLPITEMIFLYAVGQWYDCFYEAGILKILLSNMLFYFCIFITLIKSTMNKNIENVDKHYLFFSISDFIQTNKHMQRDSCAHITQLMHTNMATAL